MVDRDQEQGGRGPVVSGDGQQATDDACFDRSTTMPWTMSTHFASDADRERVIAAAHSNPRLHAAVLLAAFYGLRRASVCDLRVRALISSRARSPGARRRVNGWSARCTRA